MKTYEEFAASVLKRRDACVARRNKRRRILTRCSCVASGLCIALLAGVGVWNHQVQRKRHPWPIRQVEIDSGSEIAVIPHWEDMTLGQRFREVQYQGLHYSGQTTTIADQNMIGDRLTSATLTGKDIYTDTVYRISADIYAIREISDACALALRFDGSDDYYVFVNSCYRPDTLGQMIDDLNLREHLSFGSAYYEKTDGKTPVTVEFEHPDESQIWALLLSHTEAKICDADAFRSWKNVMTVSTNVSILGYQNISIGVTADGYLTTNILDTGKCFFIGEEAVQQFVNYVLENCEGYEIQYVYPSDMTHGEME